MKTTLGRGTWAVLLVSYAALAGVMILFTGTVVAPCLGGIGPVGLEMQRRCAEHWFATRPLVDRLVSSPIPGFAVCLLLVAARQSGGVGNPDAGVAVAEIGDAG